MAAEDLVTSQHRTAPKFMALVRQTTAPFADLQEVLLGPQALDLDTAVGVQLDVIGQWLGVGRELAEPVAGVYFSFDTEGLGYDEGSWEGVFLGAGGITVLDDDTYRLLLRVKALNNRWDGTAEQAYTLSDALFPDAGIIMYIQSHGDMTMTIALREDTVRSALARAMVTSGALNFKPSGVGVREIIYTSPQFGFGPTTTILAGFGSGSFWS